MYSLEISMLKYLKLKICVHTERGLDHHGQKILVEKLGVSF